jgi:hypothetical protein
MHDDVTQPKHALIERSLITIAVVVDTGALRAAGKRNQERLAQAMELLERNARRTNTYKLHPLPSGQYRSVPDYMLATQERSKFIGPRVNLSLLAKVIEYHRKRLAAGATALF